VGLPIAGDSQTVETEGIRNKGFENCERGVELTHSTNIGRAFYRVAAKRLELPEFEGGCERLGRSARGCVKVGVSHKEVDPHRHQAEGTRLGRASGQQPVGRLEEKRVIGHQQIDTLSLQGFDDLLVHLVTDADTLDWRVEVAELKADRIP
jgi:hypothetical protein